jgi:hypothetical protein
MFGKLTADKDIGIFCNNQIVVLRALVRSGTFSHPFGYFVETKKILGNPVDAVLRQLSVYVLQELPPVV